MFKFDNIKTYLLIIYVMFIKFLALDGVGGFLRNVTLDRGERYQSWELIYILESQKHSSVNKNKKKWDRVHEIVHMYNKIVHCRYIIVGPVVEVEYISWWKVFVKYLQYFSFFHQWKNPEWTIGLY